MVYIDTYSWGVSKLPCIRSSAFATSAESPEAYSLYVHGYNNRAHCNFEISSWFMSHLFLKVSMNYRLLFHAVSSTPLGIVVEITQDMLIELFF